MYTLNSWGSHLGVVAVDLSHQEYPRVMLDPRAINKSAGVEPPFTLILARRSIWWTTSDCWISFGTLELGVPSSNGYNLTM